MSGGGSSGGGGGGTGIVDYPAYMKTFHGRMLDHEGVDTITSSLVDILNAALSDNPFTGESAYDPDAALADNATAITNLQTIISGIDEVVDWGVILAAAEGDITVSDKSIADKSLSIITDAVIVTDSSNFGDSIDAQITATVLPRFEAGMRDINAVVSSAFVIGKSNIENIRDIEVSKHESTLRVNAALKNADIEIEENRLNMEKDIKVASINISKDVSVMQGRLDASDQMLKFTMQKYAWLETYVKTVVESNRIKIVAKKEEADINLDIDENDALWDVKLYQHGGNLLAGIGGGTVNASGKQKSQAASVIGGAMSGAVAGYMVAGASSGAIGGPAGMIGGAVLGAAMSFL